MNLSQVLARIREFQEAMTALQQEKGGTAQSGPYKEKDFALPEKDNTGDSLHVDLHGKFHLSADLACRNIFDTAATATEDIADAKINHEEPSWELVERLNDALAHIAFLARHGVGAPNPDFSPIRSGTRNADPTPAQFTWPPVAGQARPSEAFIQGRSRYPVNSAEESAWTRGYEVGFSDQEQTLKRVGAKNWASGYELGFMAGNLNQREDPPVHPGPVGAEGRTPPGE